MKPKLGTWIRIGVSLGALILVPWFLRDKLGQAFHVLKTEVNYLFFFASIGVYLISLLMLTKRTQGILFSKKIVLSFLSTLYLSFMGLFFSSFSPSAIGGDVLKGFYLTSHARNKSDVVSCLVMDRLSGFFIIVGLAFLSASLLRESWNPMPIWMGLTALGGMVAVGTAIFVKPEWISFIFSKLQFLPKKIQEKLNKFYDSLSGFFHNRILLIQNLIWSFAAQSLFITSYFLIGKALDVQIPFFHFFMMVPMITIMSMAPSVGGAGPRELGSVFLFKLYMTGERAGAMTLLLDFVIYFFSFTGGVWYLLHGFFDRKKRLIVLESVT